MQTQSKSIYSHFSPLRYPGGKQRLTPFIEEIIYENHIIENYVEPYAGGAGIAIKLLMTEKIENIHLNDSDKGIYAFWHSVLYNTDKLIKLILETSVTIEEWKHRRTLIKNRDKLDCLTLGFTVFFLNRCNRSGILSAGVIGGLQQQGNYKLDARFQKDILIKKIEEIAKYAKKISLTNYDAKEYIDNYVSLLPHDTLIYLDPPYYEKSSNLYLNSYLKKDHATLANTIQKDIRHRWILSYDGVPEILKLYSERRFFLYDLNYSAGKSYLGREVFVFADDLILPISCRLQNVNQGISKM